MGALKLLREGFLKSVAQRERQRAGEFLGCFRDDAQMKQSVITSVELPFIPTDSL